MMWWVDGFHWGWVLFGGLMMLLFWGGLIALAVLAFRALSGPRQSSVAPTETPLDILKRRYAAGEISKAEYDEMRSDLQK